MLKLKPVRNHQRPNSLNMFGLSLVKLAEYFYRPLIWCVPQSEAQSPLMFCTGWPSVHLISYINVRLVCANDYQFRNIRLRRLWNQAQPVLAVLTLTASFLRSRLLVPLEYYTHSKISRLLSISICAFFYLCLTRYVWVCLFLCAYDV